MARTLLKTARASSPSGTLTPSCSSMDIASCSASSESSPRPPPKSAPSSSIVSGSRPLRLSSVTRRRLIAVRSSPAFISAVAFSTAGPPAASHADQLPRLDRLFVRPLGCRRGRRRRRAAPLHRPELLFDPLLELTSRPPDLALGRGLHEPHRCHPRRRSEGDAQPAGDGFAPHRK